MNFIKAGLKEDALLINSNEVAAVTSVFGDNAWRRYKIILTNGEAFEFYEERKYDCDYMPRKVFVEKLKKYASIDS